VIQSICRLEGQECQSEVDCGFLGSWVTCLRILKTSHIRSMGPQPTGGSSVPATKPSSRTIRAASLLPVCASWLALACGGGEGLTEPTTGNLEISTVTSGESPDPDGYTVSLDGAAGEPIGVAGTLLKSDLTQGNHTVELSGVDGNCVVEGSNPRTIGVIAGQTVKDTFAIACTTTEGSLAITTITTGSAPDPDGYTLSLDGGQAQTVGVSATYTFVAVSAGDHTVELGGVASPCVLNSPNPQTATVAGGGTATLSFSIDCTPPTINAWSPMTSGTNIPLFAVWGDAATDVYAVGYHFLDDIGQISESTILRFDGAAWSPVSTGFDFLAQLWLTGLSGSSASDVYAVGEGFDEAGGSSFGAILHFDGRSWSKVSGPPLPPELEGALYTVSSSSPTEAYAVGFTFNIVNGEENAIALKFDGRSWTSTDVPGSDHLVLRDVWSKTGAGALAVGDDNTSGSPAGAVLRFDGTAWQAISGAGDNPLKAVWGTSASDVFAVGDNGAILHFDGTVITAMTSPTPETLVDVYGNASTDVFAVGLSGTILRYDGTEWKVQPSGVTDGLFGVWTTTAEAFAVGDSGRILHGIPGGPIAVAASEMATRTAPRVKRDIGREALARKWPMPGRLPH
jgi:hypothetical protein